MVMDSRNQHCKAVLLQLKINKQQQKPASENSYSKNERQMANSSNCLRDMVEISFKMTNISVVKCPLNPVLCCGKQSNSDDEIIHESNNSSSCLCLSISRGEGPELGFTRAHRARASGRPLPRRAGTMDSRGVVSRPRSEPRATAALLQAPLCLASHSGAENRGPGPAGAREGPHGAQSRRGSVSPEARRAASLGPASALVFLVLTWEASSTAGKTAITYTYQAPIDS